MASLTQWTSLRKLRDIVKDGEAWSSAVHGVAKSRTQLIDWTARINCFLYVYLIYLLITMTVVKSSTLMMVMYSTFGNKCSAVIHFWVKRFLLTHKTNLQGSTYQSDINSSHIKGYLPFPCLADFPECHVVGIIQWVTFLDLPLPVSNRHLRFLYVFLWLDGSFVFSAE